MKKLLLLVIAATTLFACSKKNDAKPATTPLSVVGKWSLNVDTATTYYNSALESIEVTNQYYGDYYQFNSDGSGLHGIGDPNTLAVSTQNFKYTVAADNTITLNYPAQTYLGIAQAAYSTSGVVQKANSTNLVIEFINTTGTTGNETEYVDVIYMSK